MKKKSLMVLLIMSAIFSLKMSANAEEFIMENIKEEEYLNVAYDSINELKFLDSSYKIIGCNPRNYNSLNTTITENQTCKFTSENYGRNIIEITYQDSLGNISYSYIGIDVETDLYLTDLMSKFKNEYQYAGQFYNFYVSKEFMNDIEKYKPNNIGYDAKNCKEKDNQIICDFELAYSYPKKDGTYETINKTKQITFKSSPLPKPSDIQIDVGSKQELSYPVTPKGIDWNNIIYISLDNTIASISNTGKIIGKTPGRTEIRLVDKTTFAYESATVTVKNPTMSVEEFNEKWTKDQTIDIDVNNVMPSYTMDQNGNMVIDYKTVLYNYLNNYKDQVLPANTYLNLNYDNSNCTNNQCRLEYSVLINGFNTTINTGNLIVNLMGIKINPTNNFIVGDQYYLEHYAQTLSEEELHINVDPEYFRYNEDSKNYEVLKKGTTTIEYLTDSGYHNTLEITINYTRDEINQIMNQLQTLNTISLPFQNTFFENNYDYLNFLVQEKIKSVITDENIKQNLKIKTICVRNNMCEVNINLDMGNHSEIHIPNQRIKITYDEFADNSTIMRLKEIDNQVKENYLLTAEDTIDLEVKYPKEEEFYNHLIDKTNLNEIATTNDIDMHIEKIKHIPLSDYLKGSSIYEVTYQKDGDVLYQREIAIIANPIVDGTNLENHEEATRLTYLNEYIKKITEEEVRIEKLTEDYYKVTLPTHNFNILLNQKEEINITSINVANRNMELKKNETAKIEYTVYPYNANKGKITFKSKNENIATVSESGEITAKNEGYTTIEIKVGYSMTSIQVFVEKSAKAVLNEMLNKVEKHVIADYSNIYNMGIQNAISSAISTELYKVDNGLYPSVQVTNNNDKYYVNLCFYNNATTICSDALEITYELKGISIKEPIVYLKKGDTYNSELFFTEGDLRNIIIENSNTSVVSVDKNGIMKGLSAGLSYINLYDKYNKYQNWITVYVEEDEYLTSLINTVKSSPIILKGKNYNSDNCGNCQKEEKSPETKIHELFDRTFQEKINYYQFRNYYYASNCDINKKVCNVTIQKRNNQGIVEKTFKESIPYTLEGIFLKEGEHTLKVGNTYTPEYELHNSTSPVTLESQDESVCIINGNQIEAKSIGICPVKFISGKNISYQFIAVEYDKFLETIQNTFNSMDSEIHLNIEKYDANVTSGKDWMEEGEYNALYGTGITSKIDEYIKLPNKNYTNTKQYDLKDTINNDELEVVLNIGYSYEDKENEIWYSFNTYDFTNPTKKFKLTYDTIPESEKELGNSIVEDLPSTYNLTLLQIMRYQASKENQMEFYRYSSLENDIKLKCSDCTYKVDESYGTGMGDIDFAQVAFPIVIYHNDYPVASKFIEFIAHFDIDIEVLADEETMINLIKEEVKKAYLELKQLFGRKARALRAAAQSEEDIEVNVTKEFNESGSAYYNIQVEEMNFKATVGTNVTGEIEYTQEEKINGISLNAANKFLQRNQEFQLIAILDKNGVVDETITWKSSNNKIATVDNNGKVKALANGTVTITATTSNGLSTSCTITITDYKKGDMDQDGDVDILDVMIALRIHFNITPSNDTYVMIGDINNNKKIDIIDVLYILRTSLNLS